MVLAMSSIVPTAVPQNIVAVSSAPGSVVMSWDAIECAERNGVITEYIVELQELRSGVSVSGEVVGQTFTVTALSPRTFYTLRVAGANTAGVGPFTENRIIYTTNDDGRSGMDLLL